MSTPTEIYDLHGPPPPIVVAPIPMPPPPVRRTPPWIARCVPWLICIVFIGGMGIWAFESGMQLRRDCWRSTRSIRFYLDINRAFYFGSHVLQTAESRAHLPLYSDSLADQSPAVLAKLTPAGRARAAAAPRRLNWHELQQGWVQFYDDILKRNDTGDFDLDYPPMRLFVVTLWARHVQRADPRITVYPRNARDRLDWMQPMPEDVAESILDFNTACDGIAAIACFLLVWLWVNRGAAGRQIAPVPPTPPLPHWLLVYLLATAGFWSALVALIGPPLRPAPSVLVRGAYFAPDGVTVVAIINPQFAPTQWHVDWGPTDAYGHRTFDRLLSTGSEDLRVTAPLAPVTAGQTIHFRVTAASPAGVTHSDDFVLRNQGEPKKFDSPTFGGVAWPDWTVWLRLLVLLVVMVAAAQRLPLPYRGWACGLVAALLVWFDPMNLADSHVWPQWDVWLLPAFLLSALLASLDWWIAAGILLGIGCMFKGQLLLAGPMLFLWPLFAGRLGATVRIISGFLIGAAIIVWPWTITPGGLHWLELVMFAAVVVLAGSLVRPASLRRMHRQWTSASAVQRETLIGVGIFLAAFAPAALALILVFRHLPPHPDVPDWKLLLFALAIIIPPWLLRPRWSGYWLAAILAAALWIAPSLFNGDFSWLEIGFKYGTQKHDMLAMGQGSYANLGALLGHRYTWGYHEIVGTLHVTLPFFHWLGQLDVKTCMSIIYGACLVACSAAAGVHSRRRDPRFLLTLIVPWIVFPLVLGQMGSRYLVWACAISAVAVGVSVGLSLLHVLLTILSTGMVCMQMLRIDPSRWPAMFTLFSTTYPDIGWMMLLIAAIYLFAAMIPSRRAAPL